MADEAGDLAVDRPRVDHGGLVALHDRAVLEHCDPVCDRQRLVLVVRDEDRRRSRLAEHLDDLAAHARTELDVERRERLVEQDERRLPGERTRKGYPLALAARELVRQAAAESREPDQIE